jgi:thiamine-phosphate pyrophosphorylase
VTKLYPILDTAVLSKRRLSLQIAAAALLGAGAKILQIRHKQHWSPEMLDDARAIVELCRSHGAQFVVNDRADFALLLHSGLHVGQDDLTPDDARSVIGPDRILGFSTHNGAQLAAAANEPVDYVALGPIFPTGNKDNPDPVVGLANLKAWRGLAPKPLVAIGGITRTNALQVLDAGADSVAVIGDLFPDDCTNSALQERAAEWQRLLNL